MPSVTASHGAAPLRPAVGDHICCLYSSDAERLSVLVPFLSEGISAGQHAWYIADQVTLDATAVALRAEGIDVDRLRASEQLVFFTSDEVYLRDGSFAPDRLLSSLAAGTGSTLGQGAPLRIAAEMSWALRRLPGCERLLEYESEANVTMPALPYVALCLYDRRRFDAELLLGALQAHPLVLTGAGLQRNPYYVPPTALAESAPEARLEAWLQAIADRQRQEAALRELESRYRIVADNTQDWEVWVGPDNSMRYVSPSSERLTGYAAEQFLEDPGLLDRIVHAEDLPAVLRHRREREAAVAASRNGEAGEIEYRIVHADGEVRWIGHVSTPVFGDDGSYLGRRDSNRDITVRKRTEEALRESEARLQISKQAAGLGIYDHDVTTGTIQWDERVRDLWGVDYDVPITYEILMAGIHPDDRALVLAAVDRAFDPAGDRHIYVEYRVINMRDQVEHWVAATGHAFFDGDRPVRLVGTVQDITIRRAAEQALRESEQRYRSLFTEMMTGFALHEMIWDADGKPVDYRCIDINPAFERMTGLARDAAIGKTARELLPNLEEHWIETYGRVAATGVPIHFENYARDLGRHFEVVAYSPKRGQFAVTFSDVTDRRLAADTLRALAESAPGSGDSVAFYRSLVQHLATALRVRWAFIAESLGPEVGRVRMLGFWEDGHFVGPFECDLPGLPSDEVFRTGPRNFPRELSTLFPGVPWFEERRVEGYLGVPLLDAQGATIGLLAIMDDHPLEIPESGKALLTAFAGRASAELIRARAEKALAASERKYRQIVELVPQGFWAVDANSVTTFVNETAARMLGYTVDELVGKPASPFRGPSDRGRFEDAIRRRRNGIAESYELDLVRKDGTLVPVRASASPVLDESGAYAGVVALIEDLTEQRRLERERQDLEQRLYQSQKMEAIGSLAGGVAHDFNNMLGIILGHTSLIEMELPPDSPLRDALRVIDQTCERGSALTRQLLGFARRGKREDRPFNPATLVEEVAALARRTFDRSISVETRIESRGWSVVGDPNQIHQALMNMAINARDAMPRGGQLTLAVENATLDPAFAAAHPSIRAGRYVILTVADTGVGMSAEVRARAFEPFFTTKEVGKGTGLGLASAYGIVANHGGHIEIDSEPGYGTKFSIYLPASEEGSSAADQPTGSAEMPTGTATILLVDDEPAIRDVGALVLSRLGYNVLTAGDGAQAIEMYQAQQSTIDLVVLDMSMPVLSGYETAVQLLAINPRCRLLLASGYSATGEVAELLRLERVSFIQKPFRARQLADAVAAALGAKPD